LITARYSMVGPILISNYKIGAYKVMYSIKYMNIMSL